MKQTSSLLAILIVGILLTGISWLVSESKWASSALLNIGSGMISAVVLIHFYELAREKYQSKIRSEKQRRAIQNQKITIRQHYRVLLDCYRSSYSGNNPPRFKDINEFIGGHFGEVVASLDLYAPSPANSDGSVPYYKYIENSFVQLSTSLQDMLHKSGEHLDQELYVAIDNILNSDFMRISNSLSSIFTFSIPGIGKVPSKLITSMNKQIYDHCIKFCKLVNMLEKIEPLGLKEYKSEDWHNQIFPIGHARLKDA